jgi:S-adenosylmethionine-diacylgycerolhomoserine-N-methlytransferase
VTPSEPGHVQLMDQVYRRQRHIYDLTRKYYLLGRDRLVRELGAKPGEAIVEIGCGTARNLIRIAETYPGTRLYGLDASHEMLLSAQDSVNRAGLSERIALIHGLAEDMTPAAFGRTEPFDHAIFSYSLSMIPDWRAALNAAASATRAAGRIHIADFGDLKGLWPMAERALKAWLRLFHVAPRAELLHALEAHAQKSNDYALYLLPGRYAFVLKAIPGAICGIHPISVAEQQQVGHNS